MQTRAWLEEEIREQLAAVLAGMTGDPLETSWSDGGDSAGEELFWKQEFSLGPEAALWIGVPVTTEQAIGKAVLGDGGEPVADGESRRTVLEILGQLGSALARSLSQRTHREVSPARGQSKTTWPGPLPGRVLKTTARGIPLEFHCEVSEALLAVLASRSGEIRPTAEVTSAAAQQTQTMDLLLDVEMLVSISFGRAQLALKDVIKLSSGSIVELNRAITEPVEVIVNNCVIARGEVVVIEGNYGVKIQQIISRQDRLRTLH